ncbi:alpha/beta hydrolase [Cryobacterium sp. SO2]|uniref:alpha/beta hydrolase n=1 Tax=Cryobacterium sp. SO2 TaxID=1897060 RepID=UPI00223E86D0|nr:alpha/beta hydrolase [Cryobacterium sp. SO2]WEO75876.1 alpha/beta hydrolase [Cryobacterium sp. SO2]
MPETSRVTLQETVAARVSDRQSDGGASALWAQLETQTASSVDIDLATMGTMTGANLLVGLAQLPLADVAAFAAEFPTHIDAVLSAPPEATVVSAWWTMLDATQRASLTAATPRLVGNLDGVPLAQRSRANETYLRESLDEATRALDGVLSATERTRLTSQAAMLTQVAAALHASDGGPKRSLVLLDTSGSGRAAIALGNPDTADYIGYLVPGMNYQVEPQIVNWTNVADDLYREQVAVLAEDTTPAGPTVTTASSGRGLAATALTTSALTSATPAAAPTVATISWIGYEAPDLFSVGGLDRAVAGAAFLETSWAGVRATRGADQPFVSVFAHSYGSTVSLLALAQGSVEVDALVVVGSPGSAIQSAAKLKVTDENVFVGKADWDPAVNSAFFGSDPGASSYGARVLGVHGGIDSVTGATLTESVGHNDYFKPGSESLHNMALIGTDNAELVTGDTE